MECVDGRHPPSKTSAGVLPWTCRSENRLAGKVTLTSGLLLGRYEVLRSLRHYLRAQSHGHHTSDRLEERGVQRGSARRSSLKGREATRPSSIRQTLEPFQRQRWGLETSDRGAGEHMGFSGRINTILN